MKKLTDQFLHDYRSKRTEPFQIGMNAKITASPFGQLIGKIEEFDKNERIWILLDVLGTQRRLSINKLNLIKQE